MAWLLAGIVIFGAMLGLAFRFLFFAVILGLVVAIVIVKSWSAGVEQTLLNGVLAAVGLQVGYVLGLVARMLCDRLRGRREIPAAGRRRSRYLRYPPS
jgi:hypothetical protein